MTQLLIRNFVRSKGLMIGLLLLFLTGLVSLHIGKIFLDRQAAIIEKTDHAQTEGIERNLHYVDGHIGLLLYYLRFGLANETPNLAGLSIGHRDIQPTAHLVNIRNLEEQKYASELMNPFYQLLGNMDFSFVLIYLFPLIIIAFCYNLLSEEKEGGTWTVVLSQSENPLKVIRTKLLIRFVAVALVLFLLFLIAKFYLAIPTDAAFLAYTLTAFLYIIFWFALASVIIGLQKSSSQNALLLLLPWILLTIVIPASVNAIVVNLHPVPEAYGTIIESRDGYHNKWDQPKAPTINQFKAHYPQFSKYEHPEQEAFSWFWYYAMQQMGDDEAAEKAKALKEKLNHRDKISRTIGYFIPSIHTQFSLNTLSRSDMTNYLSFVNYLEQMHESKRLYFYPKIFENEPIEKENWERFKLAYFKDNRTVNWLVHLLPLVLASLVLIFWASGKWKKI